MSFSLLHKQRLAPSQTRVIPIKLRQTEPFYESVLQLQITLLNTADSQLIVLTTSLSIRHRSHWDAEVFEALRVTYFLAGTPTHSLALPPLRPNAPGPKSPILALREAFHSPFLYASLLSCRWRWCRHLDPILVGLPPSPAPFLDNMSDGAHVMGKSPHSVIIHFKPLAPQGFDWHGPSADDAWGSLAALTQLLSSNAQWAAWTIPEDARAVVIGHSNGGQGTWYLSARYPDRILAGTFLVVRACMSVFSIPSRASCRIHQITTVYPFIHVQERPFHGSFMPYDIRRFAYSRR